MEKELLTFRMYVEIVFNRTIEKEFDSILFDSFVMKMNNEEIKFDFEEIYGGIHKDNPCIYYAEFKNPDYDNFMDISKITKDKLKNITEIIEFNMDIESKSEPKLDPIFIKELQFILPYDNWENILVNKEVVNNFKFQGE